jgi:hypothetical protein
MVLRAWTGVGMKLSIVCFLAPAVPAKYEGRTASPAGISGTVEIFAGGEFADVGCSVGALGVASTAG